MKLNQLAAKPQLIKYTIEDEKLVEKYGEAIEFWTWDRQPLDVFMQLANAQNTDMGQMLEVIRTLILDENGKQIITKEIMLPSDVLVAVIGKIVETLGK
jgi:hypothetical protein